MACDLLECFHSVNTRNAVATPNYGYEKRQKELAKKQKKEEKLKAKAERKRSGQGGEQPDGAEAQQPDGEEPTGGPAAP
jgi:hypothetical protein